MERKITARTKAILPIHYAGCPCLIEELKEVAQRHNLILIEDAAEAMGASIKGRKVGTFGDSTMLSFCQNKVITTGEGGAVMTNSREIYEKLKLIRSHGRLETADYFSSSEYMDYIKLGYNFRMSNITAALGLAQLRKIDKLIKMRRGKAQLLSHKLSQIDGVKPPDPPDGFYHVYQIYSVTMPAGLRDSLLEHLTGRGIASKVCFYPIHQTHLYKNELKYKCELPVTEAISQQTLTLPMYPSLTEEEIDFIASEVRDFFTSKKRAPSK